MIQAIVDLHKAAGKQVNPDGTNKHGRRDDRSRDSVDMPFPLCWLLPFTVQDPVPGDVWFTTPMVVGFWEQDSPDTSEEQREDIIRRMDILATQYIGALRLLNKQYDIRNVRREPQYRMFSGTLSGVAISFNYLTTEPC